jgi:hypothetical protein
VAGWGGDGGVLGKLNATLNTQRSTLNVEVGRVGSDAV